MFELCMGLQGYGTSPGSREARMAAERRQGKLIEAAKRKWETEAAKNLQFKFCALGFALGVGGGYVLRCGI
ncbi:hypothetical protein BRADI_3g55405v3 [Brachypodium distachyon]|uniref:Uncharacterized protein n=1 Tax=Brachypodium distachyon TaxID=15368 RepID=A0A2K2D587_BRADI|nr:hypothetical protein BRADI_3g55405v3 [Brachypodium distachyon]